MKIVLVQPSSQGKPSLRHMGMAYLASSLEGRGHSVSLIDNDLERLQGSVLQERIEALSPDVIGITSNLINRRKALRIADLFPDFPYLVFGGPQPTLEPAYFCTAENRYVIAGEAERSFHSLLSAIENANRDLSEVPGLVFRRGDSIQSNPPPPLISHLDELPFASVRHFDHRNYHMEIDGVRATNLITSRGCPNRCIYCYSQLNGRFRQRSVKSVVSEMEWLRSDFDYDGFVFWEDNLTLKKDFTLDFTDTILRRFGGEIVWICLSTVKTVDRDLLSKMARSGCRLVMFGIESGSQRTLDRIGKRTTVEQNMRAIRWCKEVGLRCKAFIIIGFPWETREDIHQTAIFLEKAQPDMCQIFLATPLPNTVLAETVRGLGYIVTDMDSLEAARDFTVPTFETENFSKSDLLEWYNEVYDRYITARCAGRKQNIRKPQPASDVLLY